MRSRRFHEPNDRAVHSWVAWIQKRLAVGFVPLVLGLLGASTDARAYPNAVVFAPTGEAKGFGEIGTFLYTSLLYRPSVTGGVSWFGSNVGVVPRIEYGASGVSFGGLEVGVDAINAFAHPGQTAYVKPIFNTKLQLVTETTWSPNVAIGAMELALFQARHSQNMGYVSLTKTIKIGKRSYGRATIGMGMSFTDDASVFHATAPFEGTRLLPIAGYESPALGPLSLAMDHVGGYSEVSSTNVALNLTPIEGVTWALGAFFANDRTREATTSDGFFTSIALSSNVTTWFRPRTPATEAPSPP